MRKVKNIFIIFILTSIISYSQNSIDLVSKVANKIINETSFEFYSKAQEASDGLQVVNLPSNKNDEVLFYRSSIYSENNTKINFGAASTNQIDIWINGLKVFSADKFNKKIENIAYDMYTFPALFKADLLKGYNTIIVKTKGQQSGSFSLAALDNDKMINKKIKFVLPLKNEELDKYYKWFMLGPINENNIENVEQSIEEKNYYKDYYKYDDEIFSWYLPQNNILLDDIIKENYSFKKHSYFEWHYANGQMYLGMLALADASNYEKYSEHVKKFCNITLEYYNYFHYQYEILNDKNGFNHRLYRKTMLDDTGAPALPFIELYLKKSINKYKPLIDDIANYVLEKQVRLTDKTFCRPEPREWTVWADDLFMSVPFLLRYAEITKQEKYYDEAANQILLFYEKLFDPKLNLYYHGWFSDTKENSSAHWSRANGWIAWAVSEALLYIPQNHNKYNSIRSIFKKHIDGLLNFQNESGMWHQVIDKPQSYEETSSSAMFTLAIARGVRNGWLDKNYKDAAIKGWKGITNKIDDDGTVNGICQGTGIGMELEFYYSRKTPPNDPRGLGAILNAGVEISKLLSEKIK